MCITPALGGSVVVSGGEDSSIIVANMTTGRRVMKIDHHRGPVTALKINQYGDVLVSGELGRSSKPCSKSPGCRQNRIT